MKNVVSIYVCLGLMVVGCAAEPPHADDPGTFAAVAVQQHGLVEAIAPFPGAGDFEQSGDLADWSGNCGRSTSQAQAGSYSLRCGGGESSTLTFDASGYTGLTISYWRRGSSLESGESFSFEWSTDGSNWTLLETSADDSAWNSRSYALPAGADNASALRLRFSTNASSSSTDATYLDDLNITGDGAPACAGSETACDGQDDDCDGSIDEGLLNACGACGAAPSDDNCNGIDDDCDGVADDDFTGQATSCGVGACGATGATSCVAGSVQDSCNPGTPAASDDTCDSVDDDCDGATDEDGVCGPSPSESLHAATFEGGLDGWSGSCTRSSSQSNGGSYSMRCAGSESASITLNAGGHESISVSFARYESSLESSDDYTVEWTSDGTTWNAIASKANQSGWGFENIDLGTAADYSLALTIRVSASMSSSSTDAVYIDDVDVQAIPGFCTPSCLGLTCGGDGCGGSCGTCTAGEACAAGTCVAGGRTTPHPEDLGVGNGADVLTIGDSWMSYLGDGIEAGLDYHGTNYEHRGVAGTKVLTEDIPNQYTNNNGDNSARTVIMTGGGNDIILGGPDDCYDPPFDDTNDCVQTVKAVAVRLGQLWAEMSADGVRDVIVINYAEGAGSGIAPEVMAIASAEYARVLQEDVPGPIVIHFMETTDLVTGYRWDGIHPNTTSNRSIGAATLSLMEEVGARR